MPQITKQRPTIPPRTPTSKSSEQSGWDLADKLNVLLYGRSGTGKTTLWATFPGPILALLCSGGRRPGELRSIDTPENRKKIKALVVNSTDAFGKAVATAGDFATVVLDHASGFADLIIKELLGLDEVPVGKSRAAGKGESWSLVSQQQYGQLAIIAKEAFRDLLNLPGNVVFIAQERTFGDETDSELIRPTVGAALTPSLTGWLNPACDYVCQTFIRPKMNKLVSTLGKKQVTTYTRGEGVEYCLRCEPHECYQTKFRVPRGRKLPDCIVDPSYDKIMAVIEGRG